MQEVLTHEDFQVIFQWIKENILVGEILGRTLSSLEKEFASNIGIKKVDRIRVLSVNAIRPLPESLQEVAERYLNTDISSGITFGHVIFVRKDYEGIFNSLVKHELTHVLQVERLGGWKNFIEEYIKEVIQHGYEKAPMEIEATKNEWT